MKVNILGTEYVIVFNKAEGDKKLKDANGYAELYSKKLVVEDFVEDERNFEDIDKYKNKVIRHEIIHAMLHEAGQEAYGRDEDLVEALAILTPKMFRIFKDIEIME